MSSSKSRRRKCAKMLIQGLSGTSCIKIILEMVIVLLVVGSKNIWDEKSD